MFKEYTMLSHHLYIYVREFEIESITCEISLSKTLRSNITRVSRNKNY